MSVSDYWKLSPVDILRAYEYRRTQEDDRTKLLVNTIRYHLYVSMRPYDSKNRIRRPQDVMPLPWDGIDQTAEKAQEVRESMKEAWRKWDEEMKQNHG